MLKEKLNKLMQNESIELVSSHNKLCFPIIERIYKKMTIGLKFEPIKVDGKLIIDGHHRYLASKLAGLELERIPWPKSSAKTTTEWKFVELVEVDWDTPDGIKVLNERDANDNGMTIEQLIEKIK